MCRSVCVVRLMYHSKVVWLEQCAFEEPRLVAVAVSRVFRLDQTQPVLLVLDEVEVPGEDRGLFYACGDSCRQFFDGLDSFFVPVPS